jgi:aspartyl protease family protein
MLKFAVICGVAAVSAVGAAQAVVSLDHARTPAVQDVASVAMPPLASRVALATEKPQAATSSAASISKSADGHYWAQADVNGSAVKFLVDTGATAVNLTADDARRLGFEPSRLAYTFKVMTATGEARAARVQLSSVSIGGARVTGVDAYVIEKGLTTSLLGMTYLGRLSEWKATPDSLILKA